MTATATVEDFIAAAAYIPGVTALDVYVGFGPDAPVEYMDRNVAHRGDLIAFAAQGVADGGTVTVSALGYAENGHPNGLLDVLTVG